MIKKIKKKAVLFSLISVLFAVLFITLFSQTFSSTYEERLPGSNIRIKVIDTYTRNFEKYVGDSIKVSAYRTFDAITIYRYTHGKFFNSFEEFNRTFHECMICGYTNCTTPLLAANDCNMTGYSLNSRLDNITTLSRDQLNIRTNYSINSIEIKENYAFEVEIKVNITYNITDNTAGEHYAKWTKEKVIIQTVPIIGLIDPKGYLNDSTKTYKREIKRYRGICEYNASCWNHNTVEEFYSEKSFRFYMGGGSFLQRYWNDMTPSSCCGIETILHPTELNPTDKNNSYIDSYYWDGTHTCSTGYKIVNTSLNSEDVHLDQATAARYQITTSSTVYCTPSP